MVEAVHCHSIELAVFHPVPNWNCQVGKTDIAAVDIDDVEEQACCP